MSARPTSDRSHVPAAPTNPAGRSTHLPDTDAARAKSARELVQWAVSQRANILRLGFNKVPNVHAPLGRLRTWLERNPHPSIATMRALLNDSITDIAMVMPGNKAGHARMQRLLLITQNP